MHSVEFGIDGVTLKRVEFIPTAEQLRFLERCEKLMIEVREMIDSKTARRDDEDEK